jgi:hypothetical protein
MDRSEAHLHNGEDAGDDDEVNQLESEPGVDRDDDDSRVSKVAASKSANMNQTLNPSPRKH